MSLSPDTLRQRLVDRASAGFGFRLSNWADRTVAFFRGNTLPPLPAWAGHRPQQMFARIGRKPASTHSVPLSS